MPSFLPKIPPCTLPIYKDGGQDADEDRQGGLGSINPLLLRIADLFNMTASTLRSPSSSSSSSSTSGREGTSHDDDTWDTEDGDDDIDDENENESAKGPGLGPKQKKGPGNGNKKPISPPSPVNSQGKYSIDTNDITVVKKNMFREGKVHFYTASLPGFI